MLCTFLRILNRNNYIIKKVFAERYSTSIIENKEIGEKNRPLNEYGNAIIFFDDFLGSSNCKKKDQFFISGRHIILDK